MSKDLPASIDDLVTRQTELAETLQSLRQERDRLVPQLEEAKAEAAKPPEPATGSSPESLLESATQSALTRYTWKAKAEGLQVTLDWIHKRLAEGEPQLQQLERQIAEAHRRLERETEARKGIEAMNAAIETVKRQLVELKARECHHIYAVNLPEFCLDEHGQVSVRPHSFKIP
ncbi:hypothetical protein [Baaleninema sp.]|uniref:hypothetical protein n=1 Tax=Baaleninema sp. TaxID=3101197 RepID=UPI003CFC50D3